MISQVLLGLMLSLCCCYLRISVESVVRPGMDLIIKQKHKYWFHYVRKLLHKDMQEEFPAVLNTTRSFNIATFTSILLTSTGRVMKSAVTFLVPEQTLGPLAVALIPGVVLELPGLEDVTRPVGGITYTEDGNRHVCDHQGVCVSYNRMYYWFFRPDPRLRLNLSLHHLYFSHVDRVLCPHGKNETGTPLEFSTHCGIRSLFYWASLHPHSTLTLYSHHLLTFNIKLSFTMIDRHTVATLRPTATPNTPQILPPHLMVCIYRYDACVQLYQLTVEKYQLILLRVTPSNGSEFVYDGPYIGSQP